MQVKFKKMHPDAKMPTYATDGSGCFDFYACWDRDIKQYWSDNIVVPTKISIAVPENHVLMIFSRSGHAFKSNVRLANCVGIIDADFRGEIMLKLTQDNDYSDDCPIESGMRIAQGMIIPVPKIEFLEVEELSETVRGAGGFGSTGK